MSLLEIGKSGMQASQAALSITSNNTANVNTEGYSRQRIEFTPTATSMPGFVSRGTGVSTGEISRIANGYLTSQVWDTTTLSAQRAIGYEYLSELDRLLGNDSTSLSEGINSFFVALGAASSDPLSLSSRQQVISNAEIMAVRFTNLSQQLEDQNRLLQQQMDTSVQQVNTLAESIAQYNAVIESAASGSQPPNNILDSRDQAITELAELIGVTVLEQSNGSMNIYMTSGQPLVLGSTSNTLDVRQNPSDPRQSEILLDTGNSVAALGRNMGGMIGGMQSYQQDVLGKIINELGRIALVMSDQLNQQLSQGVSLNGLQGAPQSYLFQDLNWTPHAERIEHRSGSSTAVLGIEISDVVALEEESYTLTVNAGTFTITDSGGDPVTTVPGSDAALSEGDTITFNGLELTVHQGTMQDGNTYEINVPLNSSPAANRVVTLDNNSGGMVLVEVDDTSKLTVSDYSLAIVAGVGGADEYVVTRVSDGQEIARGSASDLDAGVDLNTEGFDIVVKNSTLQAGDRFILQPTRNGAGMVQVMLENPQDLAFASGTQSDWAPGNNDNLVDILKLQNEGLIAGNFSLSEAYTQTVGYVGVLTAQAEIEAESSQSLRQQATAARDSVSAVNLDEEAVDLLRFQQAYSANAQIISVSQSLFDTLLRMF